MNKPRSKIRLLVLEDNQIFRDGIMIMLKSFKDISVIGATANHESTMFKIHKLKPNVILLDLGLRNQNSLRVVENVKSDFPDVKVIVMDLILMETDILQFIKAGASGFILKDATLEEFLTTIKAVAKGEKVLPHHLTESLFSQIIEHSMKKNQSKLRHAVLMTKREKEVIKLISEALTNKEIAHNLKISELTVKSHVHHILEKLALHSRLEVAKYAYTDSHN